MKKAISLLLSLVMLLSLFPFAVLAAASTPVEAQTTAVQIPGTATPNPAKETRMLKLNDKEKTGTLDLFYDDRFSFEGCENIVLGADNTQTNSKKVSSESKDDAVLTLVDSSYVATGTGKVTVTLTKDGVEYTVTVTVSPAPISLFFVTGHSVGMGSQGSSATSVVSEDGQAYSSYEGRGGKTATPTKNLAQITGSVTGYGLGLSSEKRVPGIDAFTAAGSGVRGVDSGIAYEWNRLTGEKAWVINTACGGVNLDYWQKGAQEYERAVPLFRMAEEILANEIKAGHFTLSHTAMVNFSCANGDTAWDADEYDAKFFNMWDNFKKDLAFDITGDGIEETVELIGVNPIWTYMSSSADTGVLVKHPYRFCAFTGEKVRNGHQLNYFYAASEEYSDIALISDEVRSWLNPNDVASYFQNYTVNYPYHSGNITIPNVSYDKNNRPSGAFYDGVHLNQVTYNLVGFDIAENLTRAFTSTKVSSVKLMMGDGLTEVADLVSLDQGETFPIIPFMDPMCANGALKFEVSGAIEMTLPGLLKATAPGLGKLTIKQGEIILKTVSFEVSETIVDPDALPTWYEWDMSASSTVSGSANTIATVNTGTATVANGTLTASASQIDFEKPVNFDYQNNWSIEVEYTKGASSIGALFADAPALRQGKVSIWINAKGGMSVTEFNGSKFYHYMVSYEDWKANVPAGFDSTKPHSYRLQNDSEKGVVTFYLDGKRIGDLTTYNTSSDPSKTTREGTKKPSVNFSLTSIGGTGMDTWKFSGTVSSIKFYEDSSKVTFNMNSESAVQTESIVKKADGSFYYPGDIIPLPETAINTNELEANVLQGWSTKSNGTGSVYNIYSDPFVADKLGSTLLYAIWGDNKVSLPVYGSTLIISDTIGIRYLYEKEALDRAGEKVTVSYSTDGENYIQTEFIDYTAGDVTYASVLIPPTAAKNIIDTIYVKLSCDEVPDEYSIKSACEDVLSGKGHSQQFKDFAKAILNYGSAAQLYFGYKTDSLAVKDFYSLAAPELENVHDGGTSGNALQICGTSLILKDKIALNFWVYADEIPQGYTVRINGENTALQLVQNSGNAKYWTVALPVEIGMMKNAYSIEIADENDTVISNCYTDSILSYCYAARQNGMESSLITLCEKINEYVYYSELYFDFLNPEFKMDENELPPQFYN